MRLSRILAVLAVAAAASILPGTQAAASTAPGLFAVTDYTGTLVRGSGVTGVVRQSAGRYEVQFQRNMDPCSYTATIAGPGNDIVYAPGVVTVASGGAPSRVHVETWASPGGVLADFPFHLHAMCPPDTDWAVVGGDGTLSRGSASVTSVVRLGPGRYEVRLNKPVSGCAYLATRGHTSFTGVAAPGTISTATRSGNPNAVWVETRTLPGAFTDSAFHLQVQCPDAGSVSRWAVVRADGIAARTASLLISSERIGLGQYRVYLLGGNSYGCAFVAVPGDPGAGSAGQQVLAFTTRDADYPDWAVRVETKNVGGGLTDVPFHLQVSGNC
ncbi:hypothetical protein ACIA8K_33930 [Catenuloplanes sp. NPDC051500]|uniref:hypothetical protein n=1 Tax=Catenuloplanes sp. NPDC051500 TaxID=3363959 RepID=UPI0037927E8E